MPARLTGALYTYETHFLYVGPLIASARHQHHAGQVMWVPDGVDVSDQHGHVRSAVAHVLPPNTPHGHGAAPAAAVLWVDREDLQWDGALEASEWPRDISNTARLSREDAGELARLLLSVVAREGSRRRAPQHVAVRRMRSLLDTTASDREVSLTQLAQQSGLSLRQLRHHFTQQLGIHPSAYLRWRRLRHAVACIERGASLTQAAVEAGFADGAHFSRVFQAQFGMAPSQALSAVSFAGSLTLRT